MIAHAQLYKVEVEKLLAEFEGSPRALYLNAYSYFEPVVVATNTWEYIQLVAIHEGKVKGLLNAKLARDVMAVSSLSMVKFFEGHDEEMAADIATCFKWLLKHWRYIRFSCFDGCPQAEMYAKIVEHFGGSKIGEFPLAARLRNGELVSQHYWQVPGTETPDGLSVYQQAP